MLNRTIFAMATAMAVTSAVTVSTRGDETEQTQSPVVVELFTSQGCSSCPPADATLKQIAAIANEMDLPVHVLSFHVDYWNRLGWKDPYSDQVYSHRQRSYAAAKGSRRVYTPQMIVDGNEEFNGGNRRLAAAAISQALRESAPVEVSIGISESTSDRTLRLEYKVDGASEHDVLHLALVHSPKPNDIPRGENQGRRLSHVNVVRAFKTLILDKSSGETTIELPSDIDLAEAKVIAYVQDKRTFAINGASSTG